MEIGIVILAAGYGARFGSNKLLAPLEGKAVLRHVLELVPPSCRGAARLVTQYPEAAELGNRLRLPVIWNDRPDLGQSRSVRLGVEALRELPGILFLAGDQPCVRRETVAALLSLFEAHPDRIVGACVEGRLRNPCVFPRALFPELLALEGDIGGRPVLVAHRELWLGLEVDHTELRDIDRREDLPGTPAPVPRH